MDSAFFYNGRSSRDFGIQVEKCPSYRTGAFSYEKIHIPGRHGDLIRRGNADLSNSTQHYKVWFKGPRTNTIQDARDIAQWLLTGKGYLRLEDTYDPDIYRMAAFTGPLDVDNWMLQRGRATLEFDCMPQRWLKSGEFPQPIYSGQRTINGWSDTRPEILITGSGAAQLVIGGSRIDISDVGGSLTLDCDTLNAYDGAANKNSAITVTGGWPVLVHGETDVSWTGGITAVQIIPHWWMP